MKRSTLALFAFLSVAVSVAAAAQNKHYKGDVTAVDMKAHTFTVKSTEKGAAPEMKFHVDPKGTITVGGDKKLFAALAKGDSVDVTYGSSGMTHTAANVDRHKTTAKEMTFDGEIIEVDAKANTFTVKRTVGGKVEEMKFHLKPDTWIYVGAEHLSLAQQLHKGDDVTIHYESLSGEQVVKSVGKGKRAT